ncbi:MAG TPA: hypothetical protein VF768_09530 [Holophagaceae bacterium]
MGFLDRFLNRAPQAPLPTLAELMEARGVPADLPGLAPLVPAFEAHRAAPGRHAWVDALAEAHRKGWGLPPAWMEVQEHLLPELVPSWRADREGRWQRLFIEGLCQRIRFEDSVVPEAWIHLWDQDPSDVLEVALDNLRRRSEGSFERLPSGIYRSPWRDGHDAARLLLPKVWDGLFKDQHPFLAIPTAGAIFAAPQILLPKLMDAVSKTLSEGAPLLQAAVLERVDQQLMTARIQEPHPMSGPQKEFKQLDLMESLRAQERDLDPGLGRMASVGLLKTNQGKSLVVATWMAGAPVLLPDSDLLAFHAASGEPLGIYWRQSLPRITELRGEPVEIWGPRLVRMDGFPTPEQLARLESFASAEQMKAMQAQGPGRSAAPRPSVAGGPSGAASAQASPLPRHLQGAGLGVQDQD